MSYDSAYPYGQAVHRVVESGRNDGLEPGMESMAPLEQNTILMLVKNANFPHAEVVRRNILVTEEHAHLIYEITLKRSPNDRSRLVIEIARMNDTAAAGRMMKGLLRAFQGDVLTAWTPSSFAYGDCSLQLRDFVMWTHYTHFVQVESVEPWIDPTKFISSGVENMQIVPGPVDNEIDTQTINSVAIQLNQHLMMNNVPVGQTPLPAPILQTVTPVQATQGKIVTVELDNLEDVDSSYNVQYDQVGKLFRTSTKTTAKTLGFFAKGVGTCKATLLVAHRKYFTVGKVEFDVEIGSPATLG